MIKIDSRLRSMYAETVYYKKQMYGCVNKLHMQIEFYAIYNVVHALKLLLSNSSVYLYFTKAKSVKFDKYQHFNDLEEFVLQCK